MKKPKLDKRILHVNSKKPLSNKSILMLNELVKKVNNHP